jgi:hypothetical protein
MRFARLSVVLFTATLACAHGACRGGPLYRVGA